MTRFRLNIEISPVTLRKLILWAYTRDEKKNSWAKSVLIMRCDQNEEKTREWFENEANRLGITRQELEDRILAKENFDFEAYKKSLLE